MQSHHFFQAPKVVPARLRGPRFCAARREKIISKDSLISGGRLGRLKRFRLTQVGRTTFSPSFMKQTLVQEALKAVRSPQVLVNIVSKRVRQLGQGFRPLVAYDPKLTFMDVALKEVAEGKLGFEMIEVPSAADTNHTPVPTKKGRKAAAA